MITGFQFDEIDEFGHWDRNIEYEKERKRYSLGLILKEKILIFLKP